MIRKYLILALLFIFPSVLLAQVAPRQWKDYLSYSYPTKVATASDKAYCIASNALFSINYADYSLEKISKVTGLSDIEINSIAYSPEYNTTIIGYKNGNIDLLTKDNIININDLKNKASISNKKIENIVVYGKYAYFCCAFGILVLNIENKEVADVYQFGINGNSLQVNDLCIYNGQLFAATNNGLYQANANSALLADFNSWTLNTEVSDFGTNQFKWTKSTNNSLLVGYKDKNTNTDKVYSFINLSWQPFMPTVTSFSSIKSTATKFIITSGKNIFTLTSDFQIINEWELGFPTDATLDEKGNAWIAIPYWGLIRKGIDNSYSGFTANSPQDNNVARVAAHNGKVWIASGNRDVSTTQWNPVYNLGNVHYFDGTTWKNFDSGTTPDMANYTDVSNVIIDPSNENRAFITGWTKGGLGVFENEKLVKNWNEKNSTLNLRTIAGLEFSRVFGLSFDSQNNLWITNAGLPGIAGVNSISVKTPENKWKSFDFSQTIGAKLIGDIVATSTNQKWVVLPYGNGLFVFDEKGTFDTSADDEYTMVSIKTETESLSNDVTSVAEDLDGNIWVGTNNGPVVYYNPAGVFSGDNFYASRIQIPRNDGTQYVDFLLQNERITSIVIDGGNRKWLGTANSGVFLMSPDGITQLLNFTSENSPLPSNSINTLAIDDVTGEVLISTDRGMVSYRGTATKGNDNFENLYVYPNPVRENYRGDIIVNGLMQDAQIRITDIAGNLVYACKSLGGQAVWNGTNFNGRRVNTGVYLVFCSNKDATKTKVTKLLFIH